MARSIKKGPYVFERLLKRVRTLNESGKKEVIKTWSRRSTIYPEFIGHTFAVHNGKEFMYDVSTKTIEDLCQLLQCQPQDIMDWEVELDPELSYERKLCEE